MPERNAKGMAGALTRGATGLVGETLKTAGHVAGEATAAAPDVTGTSAVQGVGEQVQDVAQGAGRTVERAGGGDGPRSVREELREIVREAALEVLVPVARKATRQAAMYAVKRGPELARNTVAPKLEAAIQEAGGPGALAKGTLSSISSARAGMLEKAGIGGETPPRPWRERPLPVEVSIDVVVPLERVYELFTEFGEYANLMSRGEVVDERPDERIEWERNDGADDTAVITFHRLSDRLTRVMVTYDHEPQGMLGRASSLLGTLPRALNTDLMRFKAFAEMTAEEQEPDEPRRRETTGRRRKDEQTRATTAKGKDQWQRSRR
jgi:hypothetical protein